MATASRGDEELSAEADRPMNKPISVGSLVDAICSEIVFWTRRPVGAVPALFVQARRRGHLRLGHLTGGRVAYFESWMT